MKRLAALALAALATGLAAPAAAGAQTVNAPAAPCRSATSTVEMEQCLSAAGREADSALNVTYAGAMRTLNPTQAEALKRAERLWLQLRDADCTAVSGLYVGGTMAPVAELACRGSHTRARTLELRSIYGLRIGLR